MNYESANFASTFKSKKRKHEKHKQGGALKKDHKSTSLFLLFMTPFCLYIFHDTILLLKRQKQDKTLTYFHCRKLGCFKKDCTKYLKPIHCRPPRFLGCLFISKAKNSQNSKYIYIRKLEKGETKRMMSKLKMLHLIHQKDRSSYTLSKITPIKIIILLSH